MAFSVIVRTDGSFAALIGTGVAPVAVSAGGELGDVVDAVSEHLPGLVRHVAVRAVVDDHVVHDVLDVRLVLLQDAVLGRHALTHHLQQHRGRYLDIFKRI